MLGGSERFWLEVICHFLQQSPLLEEDRKIPLFLSALGASQLSNREQKEIFAVILYTGNN